MRLSTLELVQHNILRICNTTEADDALICEGKFDTVITKHRITVNFHYKIVQK